MKSSTEGVVSELFERYPALAPLRDDLIKAYDTLVHCFVGGGKVLVCGNGGSAADAEHIVGELMNKLRLNRRIPTADQERLHACADDDEEGRHLCENLQRALPAIALASHSSLVSAVANDMAPDMVFAQQVYGYGRPGDVLWGISTSGNSANVLRAVKTARAMGLKVLGMTGAGGGAMLRHCDILLRVPETITYRIQELHLPLYHALCSMLEEEFFGQ